MRKCRHSYTSVSISLHLLVKPEYFGSRFNSTCLLNDCLSLFPVNYQTWIYRILIWHYRYMSAKCLSMSFSCSLQLLKDKQLLFIIGALLVIDSSILLVWVCVDPMHRQIANLTVGVSPSFVIKLYCRVLLSSPDFLEFNFDVINW